ncbi:hypothetical protein I5G61_gp84 [Mycobacterium phage Quesadilla]|uniref:Uncharacterized protein n=1 Tax=Mycobacterium phage Quesadilla TaxID=2664226 RepID=A0A5Q2WC44_9CAUD|nr:hypothetical protein I5G61_gp84 [Mycobacterium phage Quesadilla]QGH75332.1 hypothetical protein SEA_QUESADILLA_84 [Mycobacterium phage Quesadilla]
MAEKIHAGDLAEGDLFRFTRGMGGLDQSTDVYEVTGLRTVRSVETYAVIDARNVRTGLSASINLLRDVFVMKLEAQQLRDLKGYLDYMPAGEQLTILRHADAFWC